MTEINLELDVLKQLSTERIQEKYKELFSLKELPCDNKMHLLKRIAYKLQEQVMGGLSKKAKARLEELTLRYDPVNNKALRPQVMSAGVVVQSLPFLRDKRLPIPGTIIRKKYKNQELIVRVLENGFEYNGKKFKTLTAVAGEITGAHWSGYSFFGL
ncbi:MAG TPA: DUF2924 domain-containing protein [Candidatus Omnitrophota bacterium]|nr:DUF2924 domain-containing protein [Candidatus Omnitrophota bacterium]